MIITRSVPVASLTKTSRAVMMIEPAGPSQTVSPVLGEIHKIVSEWELAQLAKVRPLIFGFNGQTTIKDCLKMLEKKVAEYDIIKKFTMGAKHFVKHMQFIKWPDHATPASAEYFIEFVCNVRKSYLPGPLIVHCRAGVGRTGVFPCLDVVFYGERQVTHMRQQRRGVIQTKEQYSFCYKVVLEVLQKLFTLG
nr:tyrosine-protein phosphatase non-receptor type 20 [Oryctolagus cuniculus]